MVLFQKKNQLNLVSYIYNKVYRSDIYMVDKIALESEILQLKKKITYYEKYQELYNNINNNLIPISVLEVIFYDKKQNEKYIIAKSSNNVDVNDVVIDKYNFLIGRIIYVNKKNNIVKVQTIDDIKSFIPATAKGVNGMITGTNSEKCKIEFKLLNADITTTTSDLLKNSNILVLTSGKGSLIPNGVIIGKMNNINDKYCINNDNINNFDKLMVIKTKNSY